MKHVIKLYFEHIKPIRKVDIIIMPDFDVVKKESINKTVRMSTDLIAKLEKLANIRNVSFNQVVVQCCEYALANLSADIKIKIG